MNKFLEFVRKYGLAMALLLLLLLPLMVSAQELTEAPDPAAPLVVEDVPLWMGYFSDGTGCKFAEGFNGVVNEAGVALPSGLAFYQANPSEQILIDGVPVNWREKITILPPGTTVMPNFPPGSINVLQSNGGGLPSVGCFASQLQYMTWDLVVIIGRFNYATHEGAWFELFMPSPDVAMAVVEVGSGLPVWAQ